MENFSRTVKGVKLTCRQCFDIVIAPQDNTLNLYNQLNCLHIIHYELAMKYKRTTSQNPSCQTTQTSITQTVHHHIPQAPSAGIRYIYGVCWKPARDCISPLCMSSGLYFSQETGL